MTTTDTWTIVILIPVRKLLLTQFLFCLQVVIVCRRDKGKLIQLCLPVLLIMDDIERELGPLQDLQDDSDSSDDSSTIGRKKSKLPLVNQMNKGEL